MKSARTYAQTCLAALAAALVSNGALAATNAVLQPELVHGEIAQALAARLPEDHLSRHALDDEISRRAWDNYIESMDPARVFFLEPDIEHFRRYREQLDDDLKAGGIAFAFEAYRIRRERLRDRVAFVKQILEEGFDCEKDETYRWQRKEEPWAKNRAEWNELWRKRIKNEYVRRLIALEMKAEAAEKDAADGGDGEAPPEDSQGTNAPPATTETNSATNAPVTGSPPDEDGEAVTREEPPSPEEAIIKQYEQFLQRDEDNDAQTVFQVYMNALTEAYDPHCSYMSPATKENFDIHMKHSLVGIGAVLTTEDGALKISEILPGGPAATDTRDIKLKVGDKITAVGQGDEPLVDVMHWPLRKSVRLIRGDKGTKVVLRVIDSNDPTESTIKMVDLIRDEIKLEERDAKHKTHTIKGADGKERSLGVITLPAFYADMKGMQDEKEDYKSSSRDVKTIVEEMREEDVDGIIIDLRNNGGGALREVVLMTGHFIPMGPVVLVRHGRKIQVLPDIDASVVYDGPLVVLVNRLSASASEIMAGALQDYGRALIVGDSKTFGKGSVQGVTALVKDKNFGAVKLTNALYYRITGSSTQLKGVSSDIVLPSHNDGLEIGEDFKQHALEWGMVRGAAYRPVGQLYSVIDELTERSLDRRSDSERYVTYTNLLARIEALNDAEEMSLNLEERRNQARERQELLDRQKELARKEGDGDNVQTDIVLDETLQILADFAGLVEARKN